MGISDRVRILCERKGITINRLEKETGVGRGNVARWNKHQPGPDKLAAVASYFSIPVDTLLGYGPQAYILDLDVQIADAKKKLETAEDEDEVASLYADIEGLEESKSDTELALSLSGSAQTKKSPSDTDRDSFDDFTYAAHGYSGRLTDADKATILKMMETLAAANEEDNGQTDGGLHRLK